ncbi:MAG: hypothetical protein EA001_06500 [Oscillatoriales cyanobacterium]|nr:MAG: hypothetical protein EA001_06500 [Oscillatoriales cyanobacterium]
MNSNLDSVPGALQARLLGQFLDREAAVVTEEDEALLDLDPAEIDRAIEQSLATYSYDPDDVLMMAEALDQFDQNELPFSTDVAAVAPARSLSPSDLSVANPMLDLDAIPAIDQRYQTLLKQRLMLEAEQRPPLFPWESPGMALDYGDTYEDAAAIAPVPGNPWLRQVLALDIPTTLPAEIADRLLAACQSVAAQTLKEGVALIRAVEELFPAQEALFNQRAGWVLQTATPGRTGDRLSLPYRDFESSNSENQLTLAMFAARELLKKLTITLSAKEPTDAQEWLADQGALRLEARYGTPSDRSELNITLHLPSSGSATLSGSRSSVQATGTGALRLSMLDVRPGDRFALAVTTADEVELPPLTFTIVVN